MCVHAGPDIDLLALTPHLDDLTCQTSRLEIVDRGCLLHTMGYMHNVHHANMPKPELPDPEALAALGHCIHHLYIMALSVAAPRFRPLQQYHLRDFDLTQDELAQLEPMLGEFRQKAYDHLQQGQLEDAVQAMSTVSKLIWDKSSNVYAYCSHMLANMS